MPIWLIVILALILIILSISIVLYFVQDKLIFHAEKLSPDYQFSFKNYFDEINLETPDGNTLNGLLFKVNNSKGVVLFFHNHSGNIENWSRPYEIILNKGFDILLMDYRGFGKSTGKYNEPLMQKDAELWYNYILNLYDESEITIYGRGIGATFATYISSLNNPKQLILESPMYNIFYAAKYHYPLIPSRLIAKYKFDTAAYIINVKCKTIIFHGKKNELINYKNSLKLYKLSKSNIDLVLVPDGNHYNLINHELYKENMDKIFSA